MALSTMFSASQLLPAWQVMKHVPGGGRLFGRVLGRLAPYTGTIRPEVVSLERGHAVVRMRDTKRVRNHLNSVHAIALMNLGEVATGLAVLSTLPPGARGIITKLSMEYLKKARGPLTAQCRCDAPTGNDSDVTAELMNEAGEVVAKAFARWRVG